MADKEVIYRAVAEFAQVRREADQTRRDLEKLRRENQEQNAASVTAGKGYDQEGKSLTGMRKAMHDVQGEMQKLTQARSQNTQQSRALIASERAYEAALLRQRRATLDATSAARSLATVRKDSSASATTLERATIRLSEATLRLKNADDSLSVAHKRVIVDQDRMGSSGGRVLGMLRQLTGGFGGAGRAAATLGKAIGLIKFPAIIAGIHLLLGAIASLGAGIVALLPRIAQLSGLLGAVPGLLVAAAQSFGVLYAAFSGLGGALKALTASQNQSTQDTQQWADQQRSAAESVASASYGVKQASQALTDAEKNLHQARIQAIRDLQDQKAALEGVHLQEQQAQLDLEGARKALATLQAAGVGADTLEYRQAVLAVQEAELGLKNTQRDANRQQTDYNKAKEKGWRGSDTYVQAERQLAAAQHGLQQATQALSDATRQQNELVSQGSAAHQKLTEALAKLTPAARVFVRELAALYPLWQKLKDAAATGIFGPLQGEITNLRSLFPTLLTMFKETSAVFGNFLRDIVRFVTAPAVRHDLGDIFHTNTLFLRDLTQAVVLFLNALRNIAVVAQPLVRWLGQVALKWAAMASAATASGRATGTMAAFFQHAQQAAQQIGSVLFNVLKIMFNVGKGAMDLGQSMWDSMQRSTKAWADFTGTVQGQNAIKEWFDKAKPALHEAALLLRDLLGLFLNVGTSGEKALAPLLSQIRTQLLPAIERLVFGLDKSFTKGLVTLLTQILDLFTQFGSAGGALTAFVHVLTTFGNVILFLLREIPGLKQATAIFSVLGGTLLGLKVIIGSMVGTILELSVAFKALLFGQVAADAEKSVAVIAKLGKVLGIQSLVEAVGAALKALIARIPIVGAEFTAMAEEGVAAWSAVLGPIALVAAAVTGLVLLWRSAANAQRQQAEDVQRYLKATGKSVDDYTSRGRYGYANLAREAEAYRRTQEQIATASAKWVKAGYSEQVAVQAATEARKRAISVLGDQDYSEKRLGEEIDHQTLLILKQRRAMITTEVQRYWQAMGPDGAKMVTPFLDQAGVSMATFNQETIEAATKGGKAWTDYVANVKSNLDALSASTADNLNFVQKSLDSLAQKHHLTADQIEASFKKQLTSMSEYRKLWDEVSRRAGGRADSLLQHIQSMGQSGIGILRALAGSNKQQFDRIIGDWNKGGDKAKTLADKITKPIVNALHQLINEIRTVNDLPPLTWKPEVHTEPAMKELANLKAGFAKQLETRSPSKVFQRFGQAVGQGFDLGIRQSLRKIDPKMMTNTLQHALTDVGPVIERAMKIATDAVSGAWRQSLKDTDTGWSRIVNTLTHRLQDMLNGLKSVLTKMTDAIQQSVALAGDKWNTLRTNLDDPVHYIVNNTLQKGLITNFNKVLKFISQPLLKPVHYARGGQVPGAGNQDTVPAMLMPGEFVVRKEAVNRLGVSMLESLNENFKRRPRRYAEGGLVAGEGDTGGGPVQGGSDLQSAMEPFTKELHQRLPEKGDGYAKMLRMVAGSTISKVVDWAGKQGGGPAGVPIAGQLPNVPRSGLTSAMQVLAGIVTKLGGIITSTTGGVHAPGSYHYAGEAIDIAPVEPVWKYLFARKQKFAEFFGPTFMQPDGGLYHWGQRFYDAALQAQHMNHIHVAYTGARAAFKRGGMGGGIASLLTPGEFVFNTDVARAMGQQRLEFMNRTGVMPAFGGGGLVGGLWGGFGMPSFGGGYAMGGVVHAIGDAVGAPSPLHLTLVIDGKTITRTVALHGREARIVLGGRG